MNVIVMLAMIATAATPTESEVKEYAIREGKTHLDQVLKAPSTADYGAYRIKPLGQTAIYPGNRYQVEGFVDSANALGTKLRGDWTAVVHITPQDKLALLGLTYTGLDGKTHMIFEAEAEAWCRPDVYRRIHDEYRTEVDAIASARKKLPSRSRKAFTDKKINQYLASVRKKYGLTPEQLVKILGL